MGQRATALDRARLLWREAHVETRAELRKAGVRGDIRRIDKRASGAEGVAVPNDLFGTAYTLAQGNVPMESALGRMVKALTMTVQLAYQQHESEQRGPHKAG